MWTFYKRQSNGVCYSDDHSEEVLCAALSSDGKKAITGQYNYRPQTKFAKVTFSYVSVCPRKACMAWGHAWWGHAWWGACMAGEVYMAGGHVWRDGMHGRGGGAFNGRGHAWWWGVCMAGGIHGGGHVWQGACIEGLGVAGEHAWWGTCMAGGMCGQGVCVAGRGACVAGGMHGRGHVWQRRCGREVCVAGETATVAGASYWNAFSLNIE